MEPIKNMSNNLTHFQCVGEFHKYSGHPTYTEVNQISNGDVFNDSKLVSFRISLIEEEFKECMDAIKKNDIIEFADGLCDLLYVVNGAGHVFGINLDDFSQ